MNTLTTTMSDLSTGAFVRTTMALEKAAEGAQRALERATTYRWAWLVLIGILVIAAAIAWVYCRNAGYRGFSGAIEAVRNGWNIKIGIKLGCY
jgi:hypothetical protein